MRMDFEHPIINLSLLIHFTVCHSTECHSTVLFLEQAVVAFHGVEAVAGSLVAGEGSVVGGNKKGCMGASMEPVGVGYPIPSALPGRGCVVIKIFFIYDTDSN